jgi:phosphatidylglycerophosphatase A
VNALERWSPAIFWTAASALILGLLQEELRYLPALTALGAIALAAAIGLHRRRRAHFDTLKIRDRLGAKLAADVATVLGAGLTPKGSGTAGAVAALPLAYAIAHLDPGLRVASLAALTALSVFATDRYLRYETRTLDPKEVVVDELVGVSIAIAFVPWTLVQVAAAFVLFRFFDIVKPGPIGWLEKRLPGAWGVMFDDVLAGLIAGLLAFSLRYVSS